MSTEIITTPCVYRPQNKHSLIPLIERTGIKNGLMVEVGCYAGESTEMFALSGRFSSICAIDPWDNEIGLTLNSVDPAVVDYCDMDIVEREYDKRMEKYLMVKKIKTTSDLASKIFYNNSLDLVYLDADHRYHSVKGDIILWKPKIKKGGFIAGHDYNSRAYRGVIRAVDESFRGYRVEHFRDSSWLVEL